MEFQTTKGLVLDKTLRNVLNLVCHLLRKGLVFSKKFVTHLVVMIKKRSVIEKSASNLSFLSPPNYPKQVDHGASEYEFSCNETPIPTFFHGSKKKHFQFFCCVNFPEVLEGQEFELPDVILVPNPKTPEYGFNNFQFFTPNGCEKRSPMISPFSVRISNYSNYSSEDESNEAYGKVDHKAEEFIKRFYEQLRMQY